MYISPFTRSLPNALITFSGSYEHKGFNKGFLCYSLVLLNELQQIGPWAVLQDDPQVIAGFIPIVELEYVRVIQIMENPQLRG